MSHLQNQKDLLERVEKQLHNPDWSFAETLGLILAVQKELLIHIGTGPSQNRSIQNINVAKPRRRHHGKSTRSKH